MTFAGQRLTRMVGVGAMVIGVACSRQPELRSSVKVVVSVLPLRYFVEQLGGEAVEVRAMIPPGANPSTFEPTIDALQAFASAELFVGVGHPRFVFEQTWIQSLLADNPDIATVEGQIGESDPLGDPHVWLSPTWARRMVRRIARALGTLRPEWQPTVQEHLSLLLSEIDDVDVDVRSRLEPFVGMKFFVYHAAWGHFATEYGLEQVSLAVGGKEPGARDLANFIDAARKAQASVIFVQPQFSERSARVAAREVGARVEEIDPLAVDWPVNLRTVAVALQGAFRK